MPSKAGRPYRRANPEYWVDCAGKHCRASILLVRSSRGCLTVREAERQALAYGADDYHGHEWQLARGQWYCPKHLP